ncbi:hypothetical protein MXB_3093 [Myxobolus squamalis]|nr:hypothetical protein MXB_3093 [Myxobolus squamalis]
MLALAIFLFVSLNSFYTLLIERKSFDRDWLDYKSKYNLDFSESEEKIRKETFLNNNAFIIKSNSENKTFTLKMNHYGHFNKTERGKLLTSFRGKSERRGKGLLLGRRQIPYEIDWRNARIVSSVKNQLNCGSCYAFSAVKP